MHDKSPAPTAMPFRYVRENLFALPAAALVLPVDCDGVLAGGLGCACAARFPAIVPAYEEACRRGELQPGRVAWLPAGEGDAIGRTRVIALVLRAAAEDAVTGETLAAGLAALAAALAAARLPSVAVPRLDYGPAGPGWPACRTTLAAALGPLACDGVDVFLTGEGAAEEAARAERAQGNRRVRMFQSGDRCLSNMYRAPVAWGDGVTPARLWPCNELPYVLAKTLSAEARAEGVAVFRSADAARPGSGGMAIKRWGSGLALRPDWESVKDAVMLALARDKLARNPALAAHLLATGEGLIEEGNGWGDLYWGVALRDDPARGIVAGQGQNRLGRIMMQVRAELRRGERHLALPLDIG